MDMCLVSKTLQLGTANLLSNKIPMVWAIGVGFKKQGREPAV